MNPSLYTPDELLAGKSKPQLETVSRFVLSAEDCLVLCGGFEDRATAILENAAANEVPFNVVLILYEPEVAGNRADAIRKICQDGRINLVELSYDRQEPAGFGYTLLETLPTGSGRVFIDISGMSRLLIVQVLVALQESPKEFSNCFIAYTEAQTYPPTEEQANTSLTESDSNPSFSIFFLSSGVFDVTLVPELSSSAPAGVHTRLVAFPSLDSHQLTALRAELQPSRLSFIEGVPPAPGNNWRLEVIAKVNRLDEIQNAERYPISTLYYQKTLSRLLKIYAEHNVHERLLISPTGSKMQAVAVGIFRSIVKDVQIVYPTPHDFLNPEKYTQGIGRMHLLSLEAFSKNNVLSNS